MKKFILGLSVLLWATTLLAQNKPISKTKLYQSYSHKPKLAQQFYGESLLAPNPVSSDFGTEVSSGKTTGSVSPILLGRASNAFTIMRQEQNQVYANDSLDMVAFIHRQDVTIYGGGTTANGKLRYDLSLDAGATFSNDNGILNTSYLRAARYPNLTLYNPSGNTNPMSTELVWVAPTLAPGGSWDGHVNGLTETSISVTSVSSTEHYDFTGRNTLLPGGLTQGLPGEFWAVDFAYDGTNIMDSLYLYKGTYASGSPNDVSWVRQLVIDPGFDKSIDGSINATGPNVAFSQDGMTGYIALLSDLTGTPTDSSLHPVFIKTTDGGATWGSPVEVDINATAAWVYDTLRSLWVDEFGSPISDGQATTGFDFDLTVDANGNPHLAVVVGSQGSGSAYSIAGTAKFLADITSTDGGTTWDVIYISPVLTFRLGTVLAPDPVSGDVVSMDNCVQVSRSPDAQKIFFSWVDSDTCHGNLGETDNIYPNLRIAGYRVSDGYQTPVKLVSDGDFVWDNKIFYPSLAPEVLTNGTEYKLPIVSFKAVATSPYEPVEFWYFGNDAVIDENEFQDPSSMDLSWNTICKVTSVIRERNVPEEFSSYVFPNPSDGEAAIRFELQEPGLVSCRILNLQGQVLTEIPAKNFGSGINDLDIPTMKLASGMYLYQLSSEGKHSTGRFIITKK